MRPCLPSETSEYKPYLSNPDWVMSQKIDGSRLMVIVSCDEDSLIRLEGFNRSGGPIAVPKPVGSAVVNALRERLKKIPRLPISIALDGEVMDGVYYIFDMLNGDGAVGMSLRNRLIATKRIYDWMFGDTNGCAQYVKHFIASEDKVKAFEEIREQGHEGVVFKNMDSPYIEGRSGNWVKFKFTKTVDCVVMDSLPDEVLMKNLRLGVYDGDNLVEVGKVSSLTGDGPKAKIGDVLEIKILYVSNSGRLVQPTMPKLRLDKTPTECTLDQLTPYKTNKTIYEGS